MGCCRDRRSPFLWDQLLGFDRRIGKTKETEKAETNSQTSMWITLRRQLTSHVSRSYIPSCRYCTLTYAQGQTGRSIGGICSSSSSSIRCGVKRSSGSNRRTFTGSQLICPVLRALFDCGINLRRKYSRALQPWSLSCLLVEIEFISLTLEILSPIIFHCDACFLFILSGSCCARLIQFSLHI